jgi:putative ABC transport system permease protein
VIARQAIRNLLASKLRLFLTSLAVVLGVGFVVGAIVLGDTINKAFDGVFATANSGVAVEIRGAKTVSEADRQRVPTALLAKIRQVDGVRTASGSISGTAQIIGSDGKPAGIQGPPALGFSWSDDPELNPLRVSSGTAPRGANDVVIDRTTAKAERFAVGDDVRIITQSGSAEYRLVGTVTFGEQNNLAGATLAAFSIGTAERVLDASRGFAAVTVTADPGVGDSALTTRIRAVLPAGYEAITGQAASRQESDQFKKFVDIFRNFLLAFAGVALFVGSFIIFNAFRITVAQRTRQLGLLRAIGASESQVVRSVLLEAGIIGLAASLLGILFGIAFAALLRSGFNAVGASLPSTSLQVHPPAMIIGLLVGMGVTVTSALVPAWKASHVPPIAAMRDIHITASSGARGAVSVTLATLGVGLVLTGLLAPLSGLTQRFGLIGVGAMLLFLGAAMLTQYIARPLARFIGAPMARLGLAGRLGRANAMRNPSRTAQTAAALTIGVALVTAVTVFAASLSATYVGALDKRVRAQLVILASNQQPFSTAAARTIDATGNLPGATAWRRGEFKDTHKSTESLAGIDPARLGAVYDLGLTAGSIAALSQPDTIAVQQDYARDNALTVGSTMPVLFAKKGATRLHVAAIFSDDTFGKFFISLRQYSRDFTTQQDQVILVPGVAGQSPEVAKTIAQRALRAFPNLDVRTKAEYKHVVSSQITMFLRIFYALLAMAVIIAIFGIVLTLAISVFERTREIGLLRAVGLSRHAVRAMIRWEAIIVALIGALVGLGLGLFLGSVSVSAIPDFKTLAIPWGSMIIFFVAAGIFGVLAAILPARRAARLNILHAIQDE